jgi:hypothetical protein
MGPVSTPDCSTPLSFYLWERTFKVWHPIYYMSGPGEGKIKLGKADVYIHVKGKSGATVTHIDIELDELNEILKPGESTFVGAKPGGVFIGLKKHMIQLAEEKAKEEE